MNLGQKGSGRFLLERRDRAGHQKCYVAENLGPDTSSFPLFPSSFPCLFFPSFRISVPSSCPSQKRAPNISLLSSNQNLLVLCVSPFQPFSGLSMWQIPTMRVYSLTSAFFPRTQINSVSEMANCLPYPFFSSNPWVPLGTWPSSNDYISQPPLHKAVQEAIGDAERPDLVWYMT